MHTKLTGTNPDKPTIYIEFFETGRQLLYLDGTKPFFRTGFIEFFETGRQLLYLDGTKPFFRTGLTVEEARTILTEANYTITEEEVE